MTEHESPVVYVVDDDPAARKSLCALVRSRGLTCEAFASAEEFLSVLTSDRPGAVITDLRMDGMSGLELQQLLVQRGSQLPVIVVSGHADIPVTVTVMSNGAVTLLQKPYEEHALLRAIDVALKQNLQRRERTAHLSRIRQRLRSLSEEETRIMRLLIEGHANKTIAREVLTSLRTVDRRRRSIMDKMGVESVAELVKLLAEYSYNAPQTLPAAQGMPAAQAVSG